MAKIQVHSKYPSGKLAILKIYFSAKLAEEAGLLDKEVEYEVIPAKDGKPGQIIIKAKEEYP